MTIKIYTELDSFTIENIIFARDINGTLEVMNDKCEIFEYDSKKITGWYLT